MTGTTHRKHAAEDFEKRAPGYTMTVELNQPPHRHLKFRIDGSMAYGFDIITWPGHLAISGDMGCYVFSRLADMFEFFRGHSVNPSYWAEKIQAASVTGGYEEYSPDRFRDEVLDWVKRDDEDPDEIIPQDLLDAVEDEVLAFRHDDEQTAISAAVNFTHDGRHVFQDFWEVSCREYTHHYLWCINAIVWAISQYDEAVGGGE